MELIFLYLGVILAGYFVGSKIKKSKKKIELKWSEKVQTVCLFLLIFTMGSRIGSDESVIASLGTIGVSAVVITAFVFAGSLICSFIARKAMRFDKEGYKKND